MKDLTTLALILAGIQEMGTKELLRLLHAMTKDKAQLAADIREFCRKYEIDLKEDKYNG